MRIVKLSDNLLSKSRAYYWISKEDNIWFAANKDGTPYTGNGTAEDDLILHWLFEGQLVVCDERP